jgi:hypothetical protein
MTCNKNKGPNSKTVSAKGGDKITVTWAHNTRGDEVIADSHKGPVQVYVAPGASNGKGNVWVKIASEGYENGKWATDKLRANKGQHSFTLPQLAPGDYLIRPEIIALHEGSKVGGTQLYMACVQVKLSGTGTKVRQERLDKEITMSSSGCAQRHSCRQDLHIIGTINKYLTGCWTYLCCWAVFKMKLTTIL